MKASFSYGKQVIDDPINQAGIRLMQHREIGEAITKLAEQDTTEHIQQHMLTGRQGRQADQTRHNQCQYAPRKGNPLVPTNADPAEPGNHTMKRRKDIISGVNPIQKPHEAVPYCHSVYLRSSDCRGEKQKNEKTNAFSEKIGTEKTICPFPGQPRDKAVHGKPEKKAAEIDAYRPGDEWKCGIDGKCQRKVMEVLC